MADRDGGAFGAGLEDLYSLALRHVSDAVFVTDPAGGFVFISPNVGGMFGYSADEVAGLGGIDRLLGADLFDPVELERWGEIRNISRTVADKLNRLRHLSIDVKKVAGGPDGVLYTCRDVTDRFRAEERLTRTRETLTTLFNATPAALLLLEPSGRVIAANDRAGLDLGVEAEALIGRNFADHTPAECVVSRRRRIAEATRTGLPVSFEDQFRGRFFHNRVQPVVDADGGVVRLAVFSLDVTDVKEAEAALSESRRQLRQAQKMEALGSLVAGVAHEINNPINSIIFNLDLFQNVWTDVRPVVERDAAKQAAPTYGGLPFDYIQANMGQLLADCELAANRIARIVRDLKDFSRRSDPDDFRPVAVNLAVENALRLARATIGKRGTRLSVRLDPQPPPVNGHLPSLEQVLLNLIINGIQAIDHDRGLLEIETTTDPEDGWVVVRVADNGRGVDESASDRLFDPFFTDRQSEGGTGLGLSVTYNIVQTHGGEIGFEPRPGGGTVFTVRLPLAAGPPRRRVLVADDDEVIRNMMAQALAGVGGFLVEQAANGEEALIKLGIFRPHLLVLDLIMPVLDGLEVCRTIRGQPELGTTRILLVTGHPDSPDLAELRKFDGVAVLPKPFEVLDFLDTARRMLGLSDEGPVSA